MSGRLLQAMAMLTRERYFRLRIFGEGILVGLFAGAVISLFRFLLAKGDELRPAVYAYLSGQGWAAAGGWLIVTVLAGLLLWRIVLFEPMCSGSGIPQIKGVLLGRMYMRWWSVIAAKLVGGVLAIGMGLSLGREGPSVQLGACAGQGVAFLRGMSRSEARFLLIAGSGAGLAAAFNAPLAGVIFCLEEITKNFSPLVLMATVAASVTATTVSRIIFGRAVVFHMGTIPLLPISEFGWLVLLGIFTGVLGQLFNKMLTVSLDGYQKSPLPLALRPVLPLLVAVPLGFFLPQIMGGGNQLVDALVVSDYQLGFLLLLMAGKFFFTMLSFGSGVPGGIFLPMLVMGALSGAVFAKLMVMAGLLSAQWSSYFIMLGMAGYFATVVRSPVTGSILILEMTGSFQHLLPLIIVSMTAAVVAEVMKGEPVYEMLLARSLRQDKKIREALEHHRVLAEIAVSEGSRLSGRLVADISWPENMRIVCLKRGEAEYVPDGSCIMKAGDFLYIYGDDTNIEAVEEMAAEKEM